LTKLWVSIGVAFLLKMLILKHSWSVYELGTSKDTSGKHRTTVTLYLML